MKQRFQSRLMVAAGAVGAVAFLLAIGGCSKAAVAQKPAGPLIEYLGAWGVKGAEPGQLDQPAGIATDVRGNVYIADAGSRYVEKFSQQGTPMLAFQDDHLKHPQSIAVDRGGAIYVSDPVRATVFVFFPDGTRYREIHVKAKGNAENTLDVTVADDGSMSVLDVNGAKVFDFTPSFRLVRTWQPKPAPSTPSNASGRPKSIVAGQADALYVSGLGGDIQRYSDGKLTAELGPVEDGTKVGIGDQFAVTNNYIFVTDPDGRALHVWTSDGQPKVKVDLTPELGQGERFAPPIAVSPAGELLVIDAPQSRVLRYRINL